MKVLGYVRVSTVDQVEGVSLDAQRSAIHLAAEQRGLELVEIVEDAGASAKNLARPGLQQVFARLDQGEAQGLIVAKLDRFSRSLADFASTLDHFEKRGWALIALDIGLDMTTDTGRLVAHIMGAVADFERRRIALRTREALAELRSTGVKLGRPGRITPLIMERIRTERLLKKSYQAIAAGLSEEGIPSPTGKSRWSPSTIQYVLRLEAE